MFNLKGWKIYQPTAAHELCTTLPESVSINSWIIVFKVYYRICTVRHIKIKVIRGSYCLGTYYNMMPTHVKTNHGCHELLLKRTSERTLTFWNFRWFLCSYISSSNTIYLSIPPPRSYYVVVWNADIFPYFPLTL